MILLETVLLALRCAVLVLSVCHLMNDGNNSFESDWNWSIFV